MSTEDDRLRSWRDFSQAVADGRRGDFSLARGIVERVRLRFGAVAAEIQRRELWRAIQEMKQ
jgi:hypothetical protein